MTNTRAKTDVLAQQYGGTHYKAFKIEPVQFVMLNDWDFCASSLLKYIIRHRVKNGVEDLKKAKHYIDLRAQLFNWYNVPATPVRIHPRVTMRMFIAENNISEGSHEERALLTLEAWVRNHDITPEYEMHLHAILDELIAEYGDIAQ